MASERSRHQRPGESDSDYAIRAIRDVREAERIDRERGDASESAADVYDRVCHGYGTPFREMRVAAGRGLRETAEFFHVTPVQLSEFERAHPPEPSGKRVEGWLREHDSESIEIQWERDQFRASATDHYGATTVALGFGPTVADALADLLTLLLHGDDDGE